MTGGGVDLTRMGVLCWEGGSEVGFWGKSGGVEVVVVLELRLEAPPAMTVTGGTWLRSVELDAVLRLNRRPYGLLGKSQRTEPGGGRCGLVL